MKAIASRDNADFKALRRLADDGREIRRAGMTLIEGPHLLAAYGDAGGAPEMLIVSESGLADEEIRGLLARFPAARGIALRDALFTELSGTAHPVGILALIKVPECADHGLSAATAVALDNVQDAGNVGAILRTAAAAGVRDIFLGVGCAGAWLPKVLRAAQGAHFRLRIREQVDLARLADGAAHPVVATVAHGGESLFDLDLARPLVWLFGNEGAGLSSHLLELATLRATIPLAAGTESLNIAAAAAICLFEAKRQAERRTSSP